MKRKRRPELEYITPLTQYRASFIASLGHTIKLVKRKDWLEDEFLIDGERVCRGDFYKYARERHKLLRYHKDMFHNIGNYLYDLDIGRIFV